MEDHGGNLTKKIIRIWTVEQQRDYAKGYQKTNFARKFLWLFMSEWLMACVELS